MPDAYATQCPACGAPLRLKSRAAIGKSAACPRCRQTIVVPGPPAAAAAPGDPSDDPEVLAPRIAARRDAALPPVVVKRSYRTPRPSRAAREQESAQTRRFTWLRILASLLWLNAHVAAVVCIVDSALDFAWMLRHWDEVRRAAPIGRVAIRQLGRPLIIIISAAIVWWEGILPRDRQARGTVLIFGGGYLLLFGMIALIIGFIASTIYERPIDAVQWSAVYFGLSLLAFGLWGYGPETTLQRAERLTSAGRYSEALTAANLALQEDPDDREALELQRAIRDMLRFV